MGGDQREAEVAPATLHHQRLDHLLLAPADGLGGPAGPLLLVQVIDDLEGNAALLEELDPRVVMAPRCGPEASPGTGGSAGS